MQNIAEKIAFLLNHKRIDASDCVKRFEVSQNVLYFHDEPAKPSAVLVLLFGSEQSLSTVLIKRARDGTIHSGQISFPGGQQEEADKDLVHTALREAGEEIGINPSDVRVLGMLSQVYIPVSNFIVQPVVGWLDYKPVVRVSPQEVDSYYIVPLSKLFDEPAIDRRQIMVRGKSIEATGFAVDGIFIWGATAKILAELKVYLKSL